jgi:hypothetical protein
VKASLSCQNCGAENARRFQQHVFGDGDERLELESILCVRCAHIERRRLMDLPGPPDGLTREELIAGLDRFFAASGVFEICRRCHEQGTGCCPPTCRVMGAHGCNPHHKYGKTIFCSAFICSALLNAISECDAEIGRALGWVKRELGPAEFHIYEMITRVPAGEREPGQPLTLPKRYPLPYSLSDGSRISEKLNQLSDEVLTIRRLWSKEEHG